MSDFQTWVSEIYSFTLNVKSVNPNFTTRLWTHHLFPQHVARVSTSTSSQTICSWWERRRARSTSVANITVLNIWTHTTPITWRYTLSGGTTSIRASLLAAVLTGPSRYGIITTGLLLLLLLLLLSVYFYFHL